MVKNLPANAGDIRDIGSIPGSGRSPRGGNGNPLQYSVHGVSKSQTQLSTHTQLHEVDKTYYCPPAINDWMDEVETC